MPAPRWLARFNRSATNRVTGPLARWLPGFGVVLHVGRRSGQLYHTPVNVFRWSGGYAMALTYGRDSQWVRNVLAQGGCTLKTGGRTVQLVRPHLVHDRRRRVVPAPVRAILGFLGVDDFLYLTFASNARVNDEPLAAAG